jgi:hypothetical protein
MAVAGQRSAGKARTGTLAKRKLSETIVDFGAPLILQLDSNQSIEIVRAVFKIVIMVWNAHVMAMPLWGKPQLLEQLAELLRSPGTPCQLIEACSALTARRQQHFADDPRAVGEWSVAIDHAGGMRLHCDARLPSDVTT